MLCTQNTKSGKYFVWVMFFLDTCAFLYVAYNLYRLYQKLWKSNKWHAYKKSRCLFNVVKMCWPDLGMCFTSLIAENKKKYMSFTESSFLNDPSHLADSKASTPAVLSMYTELWSSPKTWRMEENVPSFHFKNFARFTASTCEVIFSNVKWRKLITQFESL